MDEQRKTKEKNTFRFKSFADRVNEIDIRRSALYYIGHENEELPEIDETYFHQTIKKWTVLNLTDEYNQFSKKCLRIVTLPQLLHKKDFVVDLLLEKLSTATNLSLQPLLEILVVLGRDLRDEFYPYFQRVLDRLICQLNTKDPDQLEWTLICLAYLFKTLKPFLKRNISVVFHAILPLLDESRYSEDVTNFAVECFSFIARDLKDYNKLLEIIMGTVEKEQIQSVQGCGRLFFEIVRGVKGLFHSTAENFLGFLFECLLKSENKRQDLLFEVISSTVGEILKFIHPDNVGLLWLVICRVISSALNENETCAMPMNSLILLMSQIAQWRDGRFLSEMMTVVPTILKVVSCSADKDRVLLDNLCTLVSVILLSSNAKISQLDTSRMIKKILQVDQREVFESFIIRISTHTQFEILVLPDLLRYFETFTDIQSLELLVQVVLQKSPLIRNGQNLNDWRQYPLQMKKLETLKKFESIFREYEEKKQNEEEFLLSLIVAPHVRGLDVTILQKKCNELAKDIIIQLNDKELNVEKSLFILSILIESGIHLKFLWKDDLLVQAVTAVLPHCGSGKSALGILDQIFTLKPNLFKFNTEVHGVLACLLSSRSIKDRLLSSHCLYSIYKSSPTSPYKIFYDTESIEPTVHTYREQILLLQKLETSGEFFKSITEDRFKVDTLRFLMGMLYHNFKLLWEPVLKLIQDYSKELSTQDFWDVYKQKLEETAEEIANLGNRSNEIEEYFWTSSALSSLQTHVIKACSNQELINYRNLIWAKISTFGQIREIKNRELVTMFLQFVHDEYKQNQQKKLYTWDICKDDGKHFQEDDDNEDDDEEEDITSKKRPSVTTKAIVSTLISKMSIFVNLPNPKQLHREPELYAFYMELLSANNPDLQKIALDCVMSYKNKSLAPYREHLYAMIDEKKFKDELVNFKIDRSAGMIQEVHRNDFMQILLRILYGKMTTRMTSKNVSSQVRKGIILRFLAGCTTEEILWFLQMAFGIYDVFVKSDLEEIPKKVQQNFKLTAVWSPKKLQSTINLLELIRKQFGGLMEEDFLVYMLKLITFVGAVCNKVIAVASSGEAKIHPKMGTIFKNVKNVALLSLVNFFEHFETFPWTKSQVATLTEIFIWGTVEKLPQDSIHSPTPVLKLLLQWSENPKLYGYLATSRNEETPFQYVVALLLNDKSKAAIRKPIMAMIERLLTIQGENQEVSGIDVILPHILQILKRLKMNFSAGGKNSRRRSTLDKRDLNILSLLTQHVDDTETCDSLLQLLLPILISKSQSNTSEEVVCQVIMTLSNLIKKLDAPETYLRKIAPLFEQVQEVSARKMLCQLLMDIAKNRNSESLKDSARIIGALNAWDKRWVEQPDYDKRLDALKVINLKLEGEVTLVDIDLGVLVIYNCFHFIKYDKDMGLRDNACEHLRLLVPKLIKKYENSRNDVDYLVGDVLLNLVRRAIRDNNENVRNEGIRLLGEMVRQCSSSHQVLRDLSDLADVQDPEVDFFENVTHLQSHRHGRALLKFCNMAKTLKVAPNQRTLTQFIMPLASRYLLNEKHAGKHTLVDAAIEALGVVCQLLPWQHYQAVLKYYLQKMRTSQEHQKHCVRIVVRILDAFHFDLSQSSKDGSAIETLKDDLQKKEETKLEEPKEELESDEDLDAELDDIKDDEEEEKPLKSAILEHQTVLQKNAAKRVMQTIATILIPTLNRSITEKSSYDTKHKVNRKRFSAEREEEEILRVPIGLALVKLMQKLPKEILDTSLPGVFMKVCTFLKSPLKSVRMLTRDTLKKIMLTLGSSYLGMLLDHLTSLLTRGFQVHVLSVTIHGVLDALRDIMKPGDIESCLSNILEVSLNDIFGEIAAEKEVEKIAAHTPEAKPSSKSYIVLHIVARNIQETCLLDILLPFRDYLAKSQSKKTTMKIQECFQKIVTGLVENSHISMESLLIFIYGTISESIPDLLPGTEKRALSENEKEKMRRVRPDCFIIQPEPKFRAGAIRKNVKSNAQANAHILIEFGLEMLHIVLKRKKLTEIAYEPFLNPVLPLIRDSLKSTHIRVTTFALKCVTSIWNEGYELPEFKNYIDDIVTRLFEILHNFSTFGATKQEETFQLMKNAFKCVVALLRKCDNYELNSTHIDQLTYYIEHDLHEGGNQTMAFSLLKAMVNRKVDTKEMHDIMLKLREITIVSQSDFAREESQTILLIYMMEYTLKNRVENYLKFFSRQLSYSVPSGRLSAIQFLSTMIKKFPLNVLAKKAEFLFISLGTRLVNDDMPECRKATAECIELLISRLENETRQKLFDVVLLFFQADKPSMREMAAMLCSRFLATEKESFESRVKLVLPILVARLMFSYPNAPGRFVRAPDATVDLDDNNEDNENKLKKHKKSRTFLLTDQEIMLNREKKQRDIDHELIQMQHCILKILEFCPDILIKEEYNLNIDELAYESQKLLGYEHEWVRVNAVKVLAHILSAYDFILVGTIITKRAKKEDTHRDYMYLNPECDIKSLVLDLCAQVVPGETNPQMMDEIVKVLLLVANMLRDVPFDVSNLKKEEDGNGESDRSKIHLSWLAKHMKFLANKELAIAPHSCIARSAIFTLTEGLITLLETNTVNKLGYTLLSILVREMSEEDQNVDGDLRQQAIRVGSKLRKRIGSDVYDKLRSSIQIKLMMRRAERKKLIAQEKINDPVRAAKRKQGIQERKKASKKRKVDVIRGKAEGKKKRKRKAEDIF